MQQYRISCPPSDMEKKERVKCILETFDEWVSCEALGLLVTIFGGDVKKLLSSNNKVIWLKEQFIDVWDYRKKQRCAITERGEVARWLLRSEQIVNDHSKQIFDAAEQLGLIGTESSCYMDADYVLALGGARLSNLRRCELAERTSKRLEQCGNIVALSAMRPISDSERAGYIDTYAPMAKTEYDAICTAMSIVFKNIQDWTERRSDNTNINLSHAVRHFRTGSEVDKPAYYAIAAPSSEASRRANSHDCFEFFFNEFNVAAHSKIINCTSQIYCPYQQVRSLFFAIEYMVEFDTIGFSQSFVNSEGSLINNSFSEPINYLQEIKATIDAMYDFIVKYAN